MDYSEPSFLYHIRILCDVTETAVVVAGTADHSRMDQCIAHIRKH